MVRRLNKIYHEFPRLFWVVVAVSFVDGIGGTLLFPFFALYITQKFSVGMTQAGILLGMSSLFGLIGSTIGGALTDKFGRKQADPVRLGLQRPEHTDLWSRHPAEHVVSPDDRRRSAFQHCRSGPQCHDRRHPARKTAPGGIWHPARGRQPGLDHRPDHRRLRSRTSTSFTCS